MSEMMPTASGAPSAPITLDDIRHKALRIRDEVKDEVDEQIHDRRAQIVAVGVVAVVAVIGIAYMFGSMAGRRAAKPPLY
jgi:hypothetical protein